MSVIDAREVTIPKVYSVCGGAFGRTSLSLSKVDWIRHSSTCNGIVITYATRTRFTYVYVCASKMSMYAVYTVCVCVTIAMAVAAVIIVIEDGSHKVSLSLGKTI